MFKLKTFSLILPCYNEAKAIDPVLQKILITRRTALDRGLFTEFEVIVVDDGSSDDSLRKLESYSDQIRILKHKVNQGYGAALKTGFREATGQLIGFLDLDDTCQPDDILGMVEELKQRNLGLICGNRLTDQSQMPWERRLGNLLYQKVTRALTRTHVHDCCSGFRIFDSRFRDEFCENLPNDLNFSLAMTVSFLKKKGRYGERPIQYLERKGHSKLKIYKDGPVFLYTLLKYAL